MNGQSFVLVPEDWLNEINSKLDQLLEQKSEQASDPGPTMTALEAEAYLGITRNSIYRMAREGRIPCRRIGSKLFFVKSELDAWTRQ